MKKIIMLLMLSLSSSLMANSRVFVEKTSQWSELIPACPYCMGGEQVTKTKFEIAYFRCAALPESAFGVDLEEQRVGFSSTVKTVTISVIGGPYMNCRGPSRKFTTSIVVDSIAKDAEIYLMNPSLL